MILSSGSSIANFMEQIYLFVIFITGAYILYLKINRALLRTWIRNGSRQIERLLEQTPRRQTQGFSRRVSHTRTGRRASARGCSSGRAAAPPGRRAAPATRGISTRGAQGSSTRSHPGRLGRILSTTRYESWRCDCALCDLGNTERCLSVRCARCTGRIIRRTPSSQ